jgi:enoyl-[acyl-carrier-protein] reductase (NADH)
VPGELVAVGPQIAGLGRAALCLLGNLSSAVTGEVLHVDCGYNILEL